MGRKGPRQYREEAMDFDGDMVEVAVGIERHKFFVHCTTLCKSSKFFQAALSEKWKKDKSAPLELPADDPVLIHHYVRYLYSGQLSTVGELAYCLDHDILADRELNEWRLLFKLYVLSDKLNDDAFMKKLLECMLDKGLSDSAMHLGTAHAEEIGVLYRNTPSSSPARRLIVDLVIWNAEYATAASAEASLCEQDFLVDLSTVLMQKMAKFPRQVGPNKRAPTSLQPPGI